MWPFKRQSPEQKRPPINEDWRVGDLAVCIADGTWYGYFPGTGPKMNDICRVRNVTAGNALCDGTPGWYLQFNEYPGVHAFNAQSFRKPEADDRGATEEFTVQIKRMRPAVVPGDYVVSGQPQSALDVMKMSMGREIGPLTWQIDRYGMARAIYRVCKDETFSKVCDIEWCVTPHTIFTATIS